MAEKRFVAPSIFKPKAHVPEYFEVKHQRELLERRMKRLIKEAEKYGVKLRPSNQFEAIQNRAQLTGKGKKKQFEVARSKKSAKTYSKLSQQYSSIRGKKVRELFNPSDIARYERLKKERELEERSKAILESIDYSKPPEESELERKLREGFEEEKTYDVPLPYYSAITDELIAYLEKEPPKGIVASIYNATSALIKEYGKEQVGKWLDSHSDKMPDLNTKLKYDPDLKELYRLVTFISKFDIVEKIGDEGYIEYAKKISVEANDESDSIEEK